MDFPCCASSRSIHHFQRRTIQFIHVSDKRNSSQSNDYRQPVTTVKYSQIAVIDKIYDLEKEGTFGMGHYVPDIWSHIFLDERGRPYWLAMLVFAEIWFRHRPRQSTQIRDNRDKVITLTKGFTGDRYQFNRAELASRFNTSADAISRVLSYLEMRGVIDRQHEDADINYRGFRNLVYVTPKVEKLLELVAKAQKNVNKNAPAAGNDENAHFTERRDVGNVVIIRPATLPPSPQQRGPQDAGNVAPVMAAVSRRSSEKPSVSVDFAAQPPNHRETTNNKNSSAPPAAQPLAGVVPGENWEAPPPEPTGENFSNLQEMVSTVRYQIGSSYRTWYGRNPDLSGTEFEQSLLQVVRELRWQAGKIITVIRGGWLWANDAPVTEPDNTFIPGFYCKKCDENLQALFRRDRNQKKLFLWHIERELRTQPGDLYKVRFESIRGEAADHWWHQEMIKHGVIRDESKYYDENGREIYDPVETTWTGIKITLERWLYQSGAKPEQEWIDAVIERCKREDDPRMHRTDFNAVIQMLKNSKLVPADFASG